MKKNVGSLDRTLRIVIGFVLIVFTISGEIGPWGWIGIVPLVTALFSLCPLYSVVGINTCDKPAV